MYKAIHLLTGEEIVILHPRWKERLGELRSMDRAGALVCQGCRQQVRVKAGARKRTHFAHKHLQACSYGSKSPGILLARAALYRRLLACFGPGAATVEKDLPGLPRPVDAWVQQEGRALAYWVADAGIKLEQRQAILAGLGAEGISAVFVMTLEMLHVPEKDSRPEMRLLLPPRTAALLSPTERAFLRVTPYDEILAGEAGRQAEDPWGSLHYLDVIDEQMVTLRGLVVRHRPNWYEGLRLAGPLDTLQVDPRTGEFIYPGEGQRLDDARARSLRLEEKRRRYQERSREPLPPPGAFLRGEPCADPQPEALPCASCGQITTEYWSTFYLGDRKVCRCRECLEG